MLFVVSRHCLWSGFLDVVFVKSATESCIVVDLA